MKDIMIDIETLGVDGNRVPIISIGAVAFDEKKISDKFYVNVKPEGDINPTTLYWWFAQKDKAIKALLDPEPVHMYYALKDLSKFIEDNTNKKSNVWCNGAMFDFRILRDAYRYSKSELSYTTKDLELPWKYNQECCMRAIRRIGTINGETYKHTEDSHNALSDAINQAEYVQKIMGMIK